MRFNKSVVVSRKGGIGLNERSSFISDLNMT
jgi:hypothetical protein